jgi:hypothetical protein
MLADEIIILMKLANVKRSLILPPQYQDIAARLPQPRQHMQQQNPYYLVIKIGDHPRSSMRLQLIKALLYRGWVSCKIGRKIKIL